jgi:L-Ala-D/L-Glu epimerase
VKIRRLTWRGYRIPFRRMFVTAAGRQAVREGIIIRLEDDSGLHGIGEIAPLGDRAARGAAALLPALARLITGLEIEDHADAASRLDAPPAIVAAVRCGLDIASCDLLAKAKHVPVANLLGGLRRALIPVNATIAADNPQIAARSAQSAVATGFRCVKLKVGMMGSIAAECELLSAVRSAIGPGISIRLDANQAWDTAAAIDAIRRFEPFEVEFIEQPVGADDLAGLGAVRGAVSIPVAADEAVISLEAARAIIEADAADLLVIKPMVVGGLRPAIAIARCALAAGVEPVITTTIDSGVAIAAALHLAASFEGERACGLATAELLESDLTSSTPQPCNGQMACPDIPGLGVAIDEAKAAPFLDRA